MFFKAKRAEYQITPNLMHAYAMNLQHFYHERRLRDSEMFDELHDRAQGLALQILWHCAMHERLPVTGQDWGAFDKLGTHTPLEELLEKLQELSEDYEEWCQRLNLPSDSFTPIGLPNPLSFDFNDAGTKTTMDKLSLQSVNLHWQASKFARIIEDLDITDLYNNYVHAQFGKQTVINHRGVKRMYMLLCCRAMSEATQAGYEATQQAHRLNGIGIGFITDTAQQFSRTHEQEIIFLKSMHDWYNSDDTRAWLHLNKADTYERDLGERAKALLRKTSNGTRNPPPLPKDPSPYDWEWETYLNLSAEKKHGNTSDKDCTPES